MLNNGLPAWMDNTREQLELHRTTLKQLCEVDQSVLTQLNALHTITIKMQEQFEVLQGLVMRNAEEIINIHKAEIEKLKAKRDKKSWISRIFSRRQEKRA